jgi:cysteinyl-tRNA synthetase
LSEALDRYGAGTLRLFYLRAHYHSPIEFSEARLEEASAAYERLAAFVRSTEQLAPESPEAYAETRTAFRAALDDDLATPRALAVLFDLVAAGNQELEAGETAAAAAARAMVVELAGVLGFDLTQVGVSDESLVDGLISELLTLRSEARQQHDYATADRIRERLHKLGVEIEDSRDGTRWHLTRSA